LSRPIDRNAVLRQMVGDTRSPSNWSRPDLAREVFRSLEAEGLIEPVSPGAKYHKLTAKGRAIACPPAQRHPNAAPSRSYVNSSMREPYVPTGLAYQRPGSDHSHIQRRGF
jgi:hypothetical protein